MSKKMKNVNRGNGPLKARVRALLSKNPPPLRYEHERDDARAWAARKGMVLALVLAGITLSGPLAAASPGKAITPTADDSIASVYAGGDLQAALVAGVKAWASQGGKGPYALTLPAASPDGAQTVIMWHLFSESEPGDVSARALVRLAQAFAPWFGAHRQAVATRLGNNDYSPFLVVDSQIALWRRISAWALDHTREASGIERTLWGRVYIGAKGLETFGSALRAANQTILELVPEDVLIAIAKEVCGV